MALYLLPTPSPMKTFTKGIISILATTAIISGAVYAATWTGLATTAINQ